MLFNLARGTGPKGLCGIPPRRGRIIRPLLGLTRAEIEELLAERGVPHIEDSSNGSDFCSRNRIRHAVVPVLRELNPGFEEAAARTGNLLRRDEDCLDALARDFLEKHFDGDSLPTKELLALHGAVSSRVVRMLADRTLEEKHVEAVLALCRGTEYRELDIPGARLRCERGRLYLGADDAPEIDARPVPREGSVFLPEAGLTIRCRSLSPGEEIHSPFKTYLLKYESINGDLTVSSPRNGERYRPAGRGCTKTLKSLFAEARFTQRRRRQTPVLRDDEGVVLVPPFGAAERCAYAGDGRILAVTIEKEEERINI
ncbi:MAG: tRNA lysidine(34) synthetase TilS [Oscillospiraceae bacterium]|nr:tRNA lysidine(34) synthetase TilS [Oscillospiraceae bacterium]